MGPAAWPEPRGGRVRFAEEGDAAGTGASCSAWNRRENLAGDHRHHSAQ